jgi:hypothetical protein
MRSRTLRCRDNNALRCLVRSRKREDAIDTAGLHQLARDAGVGKFRPEFAINGVVAFDGAEQHARYSLIGGALCGRERVRRRRRPVGAMG